MNRKLLVDGKIEDIRKGLCSANSRRVVGEDTEGDYPFYPQL